MFCGDGALLLFGRVLVLKISDLRLMLNRKEIDQTFVHVLQKLAIVHSFPNHHLISPSFVAELGGGGWVAWAGSTASIIFLISESIVGGVSDYQFKPKKGIYCQFLFVCTLPG